MKHNVILFFCMLPLSIGQFHGEESHQDQRSVLLGTANDEVKDNQKHLEGIPRLIVIPPTISYVKPRNSVRIQCVANPATFVNIFCNNDIVERDKMVQQIIGEVRPDIGSKLSFYVDVSFEKVHQWFGKEDYWCLCEAWNQVPSLQKPLKIRSQKAFIKMAYLEDRFQFSPMPKRMEATPDSQLMMQCTPPQGSPIPKVVWQKDGKLIVGNQRITIDHQASIIIRPVHLEDAGNYTCVAENLAGRLVSEPAALIIYQNGMWSPWSPWSTECPLFCTSGRPCSRECFLRRRERDRSCSNPPPLHGGEFCHGQSVDVQLCDSVCDVDGGWSTWSAWSICSVDCDQLRRHSCTNPQPRNKGLDCLGSNFDVRNCTGGQCPPVQVLHRQRQADDSSLGSIARFINTGHGSRTISTKEIYDVHDIAMYVGLFVAVAVLLTVLVIIFYLVRRKIVVFGRYDNQHATRFRNDVCGENGNSASSSSEKKSQQFLIPPDLTQSVVTMKNHTVVEQLFTPSSQLVKAEWKQPLMPDTQQELRVMLPSSSTYQSIGKSIGTKNLEDAEPSSNLSCMVESKLSGKSDLTEHTARPCSALYHELSLDRHVFANFIPTNMELESMAWATVGSNGGRLCLPDSGIYLTIPAGCFFQGQSEEIFLAVCRNENDRPQLLDHQTVLSPIVYCGPSGINLAKPLVLSFPHCACLKQGFWSVTLLSSDASCDSRATWQKMVTLGQETLNTPGFCQLDNNVCHLMTEQLQRYCLIGESMSGGNAVKMLRLAAFAAPINGSLDYNLRVYILTDTADAFKTIVDKENQLGGHLLDSNKQLLFRDGGHNVCFCMEELSFGWRSISKYQEIPFQHIWSGNQMETLHCAFLLDHLDPTQQNMSCKIVIYQNHFYSNRQVIHIVSNKNDIVQKSSNSALSGASSSGFSSTTKMSTCTAGPQLVDSLQSTFRLSLNVKHRLCSKLDTPNSRGNDWRMLARQLGVDRYINFFATKSSPTECILDLWEARHREECAVADLIKALRTMCRVDCATIIEAEPDAWKN